MPVRITDPAFTTLASLEVKVALIHPTMAEVGIQLVYDNNTPDNPADDIFFTLVNSRTAPDGTVAPVPPAPGLQAGITGANLGAYSGTGYFYGPGTVFSDSAARPINDTTTTAPFVGIYKPEGGSLNAVFGGRSAAALDGNWSIQITDNRNSGTPPPPLPPQFVEGFSLSFTSASATVGLGKFNSTGLVHIDDALPGNVPQTSTSVITVPSGGITDPFFNKLTNLVVTTNIQHPDDSQLTVKLIYDNNTPANLADDITVTLVNNGTLSGANIGPGSTFDQRAKNSITAFTAPYANVFTPNGGSLNAFNGRTAAQLEGKWSLEVTDSVTDASPPSQSITSWSIDFISAQAKTLFGPDTKISMISLDTGASGINNRALTAAADGGVNPLLMPSAPVNGVGPGVTIAYDTALGTPNQNAGNLYIAFTGQQDKNTDGTGDGTTDVFLITQFNGDTNFFYHRINDEVLYDPFNDYDGKIGLDGPSAITGIGGRDEPATNFFSETSAQFMPTLAVDPATDTLGISWRDARWDASNTRVATYFTASLDGGLTLSEQVFLNPKHQAFNAINLNQVTFEPFPDNATTIGSFEFGNAMSLFPTAPGQFTAVWGGSATTGAGDLTGGSIRSAVVQVAAGPRIIAQDMGPVASGTLDSIRVEFDRPIEPSTFTIADVTVTFRTPGQLITDAGTNIPLASIAPDGQDTTGTVFFINFVSPQSATGTYSYAIAPSITDQIRQESGTIGNLMDQDADGVSGTTADFLVIDGSTRPDPFVPALKILTQPLVIPGPHLVSTSMPGQAVSTDNLVLNASATAIDLTFDRAMDPTTFTLADIVRFVGPAGPITATGITQIDTNTFRVSFPAQMISGQYAIDISSDISSSAGEKLDTNLNAGLDVLRGGSPLSGPVQTKTYATSGPTVAIDPALLPGLIPSVQTMNLSIADAFLLQQTASKQIQIKLNITYPNTPDLIGTLIAPDGQRITLFTSVGSPAGIPQQNFINTVLNDAAGNPPIQRASSPFDTGPYNPQLPLSALLSDPNLRFLGTWQLEIQNFGDSTGTINNYTLTLPFANSSTGLGETVADRISTGFRVFIQDPLNPVAQQQWTPVGPASENSTANSGRMTAVTRDPSDPSGNTFYAAGASGGVWRTTNFLTNDPAGPTWIPLMDYGATSGMNIGAIAIFPRNGDPSQTIIYALTGEGNVTAGGTNPQAGTNTAPGVGVLRSMDGGRTWKVLDSTHNADAAGNILPIDERGSGPGERDGVFLNSSGFAIVVDPKLSPTGQVIVYMAVSGGANQAGVWRSNNSGLDWVRIRAGQANDVVLAAGSASTAPGSTGNLEILYAAFRGEGVFLASQADSSTTMTLMAGGQGNPLLRDVDTNPTTQVAIGAPSSTPNGAKGRIALATPALTDNLLENQFYAGWLYALVVGADGNYDGLYVTKDFGRNWTKIRLPLYTIPVSPSGAAGGWGSNNDSLPDHNIFSLGTGSAVGSQGNYDIAIALDPTNPQIVYISGLGSETATNNPITNAIRVDISAVSDAGTFVFTDNSRSADPAAAPSATTGPAQVVNTANGVFGQLFVPPLYASVYGTPGGEYPTFAEFTNLLRDPLNPFITNATLEVANTKSLTNDGTGTKYTSFSELLLPFSATDPRNDGRIEGGADIHGIYTFIDPVTGLTRVVEIGDQGINTGVDRGDGLLLSNIGFANAPTFNRNGNLQIAQFYSGAVQPSQLAADLSGAFFYGMAQDDGFPVSARDIIHTGNLNWRGPEGDGNGVATDATGSGTAYQYRWPCCQGGDDTFFDTTDFFRVFTPTAPDPSLPGDVANTSAAFSGGVGRTFGLLQGGDNPATNAGQWPLINAAVGKFAVNPIDPQGLVIGSNAGRVFRSTNTGTNWFAIGEPGQLDGTLVQAPAFGAPNPATPGILNNFIYAGTAGGHIYFTRTGQAPWTDVSAGLDGSPVQVISADTRPGSTDAYAVTSNGVFHIEDVTDPNSKWIDITGNLFNLHRAVFGEVTAQVNELNGLSYLTALAADWRYAIPETPGDPNSKTFPVLYVAGQGGVFRSVDDGQNWTYFPDVANDGAAVDGGYLPNVLITDLDLSVGDLNPATGLPNQAGGYDLLVASTYGRGSFAIRLNPNLPVEGGLFQSGPQVVALGNPSPAGGPTNTLRVFFNNPVDEITFDPSDVKLFDANGKAVTIQSITRVEIPTPYDPDPKDRFDTYDITFTPQSAQGFYHLTIGPNLTDLAGDKMNQNGNTVNGEADDGFDRFVWLNSANGSLLTLSPLPATVVAGTVLTVSADVYQQSGTRDTGYLGQVTFTSTDSKAGLPAAYTFVASDQGHHDFAVTFKTAGVRALRLDGTAGQAVDPAMVSTNVVGGPASVFVVSGLPAQVPAGLSENFTVTALDAFGNPSPTYNGTVTFSSSDKAATLPPNGPLTNGVGTFPVTLFTAGGQSVTAKDTVNAALTGTASTIVVAGSANHFALSLLPTTTVAGATFGFTITALDQFNNLASTYNGNVLLTSTDPQAPNLSGGSLSKGVGSFFATLFTVGTRTIQAVDSVTPTLTGMGSLDVTPAAASTFLLSGVPATSVAGESFDATVTAEDAFGNLATSYTGTVAISTSDAQSTTPPNSKLVAGVGVFSGIILRTAGNQTVAATDTTNAGLTASAPVSVSAATAGSLTIANLPSSVTTGQAAGFTVVAKDQFGNISTGFNGTVTFSSTDPLAILPMPYTFNPATDNGSKTFQATFRTPGSQTLTVNSGSVTPGSATTSVQSLGKFIVTGLSGTVTAGVPANVTVTAQDNQGKVLTGFTGTASVSLTDANGTVPATITFTAADNGTITFPVTFRTAGTQTVTVVPTDGSVDPGTGTTTVKAAAAATFAITDVPASATANLPFSVTVTAFDAFGNLADGYAGLVRITSSDTRATLPPATALTDGVGSFPITLRTEGSQTITAADSANGTPTITVPVTVAPAPPPPPVTPQLFLVGSDAGSSAARVFNPNGTPRSDFAPFGVQFTGGTRVATGDFNADGILDYVFGTGPGIATEVVVIDGKTGSPLFDVHPFEAAFTGGVFVAAGDITGDGRADLVISPDEGGGPRVRIYTGNGFTQIADFFGIQDPNFRGGARAAVGDLNGDGFGDLVVAAGFGGGPRIAAYDGKLLQSNGGPKLFADFFVFEQSLRNGVFVATGDLNGDGQADLIVGGGPGGGPRVMALNGADLSTFGGASANHPIVNFFAGDPDNRAGIRVASGQLNSDGFADLIVGVGTGAGSKVTGYSGSNLTSGNTNSPLFNIDAFDNFTGGVFVG
jgi:subtilisin-like proprotein convertase family protein